ncbi:hypothetical protein ABZP36_006450 [Zizania latifolia]
MAAARGGRHLRARRAGHRQGHRPVADWQCLDDCAQDIEEAVYHLDDSEGDMDIDAKFRDVLLYVNTAERNMVLRGELPGRADLCRQVQHSRQQLRLQEVHTDHRRAHYAICTNQLNLKI